MKPARETPELWPGAVWSGEETRFSLRSANAGAVELCLFDSDDPNQETGRVGLDRVGADSWLACVPDVGPGQLYGFRVDGPWEPGAGHRFNPSKLLMDPAAHAMQGDLHWHPALFGSNRFESDDLPNFEDSAPHLPRSVVVDSSFNWQGDQPPQTPWEETSIYECHVKGMTRLHPDVSERLRGTYLGLIQEPVLEHLKGLGVTAIELLPVQQIVSEEHLARQGLTNYFGYNPVGLFAPHGGYATADDGTQVSEFKEMVRRLHSVDIEVLLDVVFNHTAEGNHLGPTLSLRGVDNTSYYRLQPDQPRYYQDFTGCGNTLDCGHPIVVELLLDCLRYWVTEMHVDGFRFDLATALGRSEEHFDPGAPFFEAIAADPVLSKIKLIAEPWDLGPEGYRLGHFPTVWSEWNDRFRDRVRSFWRADPATASGFADSMMGSPDVFQHLAKPVTASLNFVTSHDGFTMHDLVSYEEKRNWANGEDNRDGHNHNLSRNWGVEGPTPSEPIRAQRRRLQRCFLASLALARGVPMLSHGDELDRTQQGNNNAYCHDSPQTWIDWDLDLDRLKLLEFTKRAFSARRDLGLSSAAGNPQDVEPIWISMSGFEMTRADWDRTGARPFGLFWRAATQPTVALFNNDSHAYLFELPDIRAHGRWIQVLNTTTQSSHPIRGHSIRLAPHSVVLLAFQPEGR